MCRLYGFRATEETKVECTLAHAQNSLMAQSEQDMAGETHGHGWGIATYEDHHPRVERQAWAAYHGEHFRDTAERVYSRTVIAHVRKATVGPAAIENTHPFSHAEWAFAHNGTVPRFAELRDRLLDAMTAEHRAGVAGLTDSEHVFHYLLSLIDAAPEEPLLHTLRAGLLQIVSWCRDADPDARIGLNVLLTDGERLVGSRLGRTLFHVERHGVFDCEICGFPHIHHMPGRDYRAVVIASEPITHERWTEMADGVVYEVGDEMDIRVERLG